MKQEFVKQLKGHDWYHAYSDDPSYWRRGRGQMQNLQTLHSQLRCPYTMSQLSMRCNGYILEDFSEEEPGRWYKMPRAKYAASVSKEELISQSLGNEIEEWLGLEKKEND